MFKKFRKIPNLVTPEKTDIIKTLIKHKNYTKNISNINNFAQNIENKDSYNFVIKKKTMLINSVLVITLLGIFYGLYYLYNSKMPGKKQKDVDNKMTTKIKNIQKQVPLLSYPI